MITNVFFSLLHVAHVSVSFSLEIPLTSQLQTSLAVSCRFLFVVQVSAALVNFRKNKTRRQTIKRGNWWEKRRHENVKYHFRTHSLFQDTDDTRHAARRVCDTFDVPYHEVIFFVCLFTSSERLRSSLPGLCLGRPANSAAAHVSWPVGKRRVSFVETKTSDSHQSARRETDTGRNPTRFAFCGGGMITKWL